MGLDEDFLNTSSSKYEHMNQFYGRFNEIHTWLSLILCCCGLMANLVTVAVLTRSHMASVVNKLLTAVALCDSFLQSLYLLYIIHYKFLINVQCPASRMTLGWTVFVLIHANLSIVLRAVSLWLSVIIAAYRKRVLYSYQPNGFQENYCFAYKSIAATVCLVCVTAAPIFFGNAIEKETIPEGNLCDNETFVIYRVVQSNISLVRDNFLFKFNHFINAILLKLLPCAALTYYLSAIVCFLCQRKKRRDRLLSISSKNRLEINSSSTSRLSRLYASWCPFQKFHPTTILLIAILLMTILCELPNAITSALSGLISEEFHSLVYRNLGDVFDLLSLFNGLTTFLLYCIMSKSFRKTFFGFWVKLTKSEGTCNIELVVAQAYQLQSYSNGNSKYYPYVSNSL